MWAYTNKNNTQTSPDIITSTQQPSNNSLVFISLGTLNNYNYNYNNKVPIPVQQPTNSLIPVSSSLLNNYNYNAYNNKVNLTN